MQELYSCLAYHLVLSTLISFYFSQCKSFRRRHECCVFTAILVRWLYLMPVQMLFDWSLTDDGLKGGGRGG